MLKKFINLNIWLSRKFDYILPEVFKVDGHRDFIKKFAPTYIRQGLVIIDIGGGKNPFITPEEKKKLNSKIIGVDISSEELIKAPLGAYDEIICEDISKVKGSGQADLIICKAVLEHVHDVESAMRSIASLLKSGGVALLFVPSRNAAFARLNLLLPEKIKKWLLFSIFPKKLSDKGFVSYYDHCTPKEIMALGEKFSMDVEEERYYYLSSYFTFLFPLYVLWRFWIVFFKAIRGRDAAETFCLALRKR